MPDPKTCRTCRWWGESYTGACGKISEGYELPGVGGTAFIDVRVSDDYGLDVRLKTGPDFGCTLHEPTTE